MKRRKPPLPGRKVAMTRVEEHGCQKFCCGYRGSGRESGSSLGCPSSSSSSSYEGESQTKPDMGQWDERDLKWAIRVWPRGLGKERASSRKSKAGKYGLVNNDDDDDDDDDDDEGEN
ncbi:predicted protein [Histoplasma capsulatum var. duboisii H88]|uniref:Predicted protein n=1 Tax=Ajellomyces capsulatus (strain H88) TaxID=544711 RepID=F0UHW2_AJEC8|nr:predicted protein [Histoplasma capsulatum var. duboisii H88]